MLLDSSASYNIDGLITEYKWTVLSGSAAVQLTQPIAAITQAKGLKKDTYFFALDVKDSIGLSAQDAVQVTVDAPALLLCDTAGCLYISAKLEKPGNCHKRGVSIHSASGGQNVFCRWFHQYFCDDVSHVLPYVHWKNTGTVDTYDFYTVKDPAPIFDGEDDVGPICILARAKANVRY